MWTLAVVVCVAASWVGCRGFEIGMARWMMAEDPPEVPAGTLVIRDIEFGETPTGKLRLDVYRAQTPASDALPVVLYAYGGGWISGDRHQIQLLDLLRFVERGYALVTADYRWSSDAIFPAQIHDVKRAIRWIRANAADQGFDPERIAVLGASAGGHLAALAGSAGDVEALEGPVGAPAVSSRVQAVVDFFGPTDFSVYREQHVANGLGSSDRLWFLDMLIGGPLESHPDRVQRANPIRYVDPGDPPFLIIHGDADPVVPIQQSELLATALERAGVEVTLRRIDGGNHGRSPEFASDALFDEIVAFLDQAFATSARRRAAAAVNSGIIDSANPETEAETLAGRTP